MAIAAHQNAGLPVRPNPDSIRLFCDFIFGRAEGFVPIRILAEKGGPDLNPVTPFVSADGRLADTLCRHAESAADRGAALYVVPGTVTRKGRATSADIVQLTTVLIDLDDGDIEA